MNLFAEDPDQFSERNRLKIQSNVIAISRDRSDLSLAEVNIPAKHLEKVIGRFSQLVAYLRQQTGISLPIHKPIVSVQASFLLKNKKHPSVIRVYTGTYQKSYQDQNVLAKGRRIGNVQELSNLTKDATTPSNIVKRLDSGTHFPSSEWEFTGLVSVVLIFNSKAKIIPRRSFQKIFYDNLTS